MNKISVPMNRQSGLSLPMAMIMLVGLMLGSVALIRSVDTSTLVAGNLAFKHSSTLAAERGIEVAVVWLNSQVVPSVAKGLLNNTNPEAGYCSSHHASDATPGGWDPTRDWTAACTPFSLATDAAGNQVDYLIHRLCPNPNESPARNLQLGSNCSTSTGATTGSASSSSRRSNRDLISTSISNIAYRITVRVRGDRGTRSFVQTTVLIPDNTN